MLSFLVISPYWMRYPEEHFSMANANFSSCDANKTLWKPTSFLTAKANDQFEESGAPKLLSGSVRVDGYNRHLDILYDAKILVSR